MYMFIYTCTYIYVSIYVYIYCTYLHKCMYIYIHYSQFKYIHIPKRIKAINTNINDKKIPETIFMIYCLLDTLEK